MAEHSSSIVYTSVGLAIASSLVYIYYQYYNTKTKKKNVKKDNNKTKRNTTANDSKVSNNKNNAVTKPKVNNNNKDDDDGDDDLKDAKGYKITKDGKKTSYFTRELSDAEKTIIGDFTPQLLSSSTNNQSNEPRLLSSKEIASPTQSNGSVWNTGSFEEKYYNEFAETRLKKLVKEVVYNGEGVTVTVLSIKNCSGDALLTFSRGKRKYIYDYQIEADFKLLEKQSGNILIGKIFINDITGDCDYEIITKVDSNTNNNYYKKYVQSTTNGLQPLLKLALDRFLNDFMEHTN